MSVVDWSRWRACPVCPARLGEPCLQLSGVTGDGPVTVPAPHPHTGRKPKIGAAWREAITADAPPVRWSP